MPNAKDICRAIKIIMVALTSGMSLYINICIIPKMLKTNASQTQYVALICEEKNFDGILIYCNISNFQFQVKVC